MATLRLDIARTDLPCRCTGNRLTIKLVTGTSVRLQKTTISFTIECETCWRKIELPVEGMTYDFTIDGKGR